MINYNLDYLNFDAYGIKRSIKQKLSENPYFTDYIFEDSNFNTLLDTYAQFFQVIMFYLNSAAAESMFQDVNFYENISRMVKLINYNAAGYSTPLVEANITITSEQSTKILPFTTFPVNTKSANGTNEIKYSTIDYSILSNGSNNYVRLYAGGWKVYNEIKVATGIPYEEFILNNLYSDSTKDDIFAYPHLKVFVKRQVNNADKYYEFKFAEGRLEYTDNTNNRLNPANRAGGTLFYNEIQQTPYSPTSKVFELSLNEYKQARIKFGNGIYGEKLQPADELIIFYLQAIGEDSNIGANAIDVTSTLKPEVDGISDTLLAKILFDNGYISRNDDGSIPTVTPELSLQAVNTLASTLPEKEENVDDIRYFAPKSFSQQNRLVTREDFDYFVRSNSVWRSGIADVKVMNNAEYISTFYRWLYNLEIRMNDILKTSTTVSYITDELRAKYDYYWSDACDFNNIYIFIQYKTTGTISNNIKVDLLNKMQSRKCLTSEPIIMTPVTKYFCPCAYPILGIDQNQNVLDTYFNFDAFDTLYENYIEVTIDSATLMSAEAIRTKVINTFTTYFNIDTQRIGNVINLNQLHGNILAIDGVKEVRTVFKANSANENYNLDDTETNQDMPRVTEFAIPGISMAAWCTDIVEGADIDIITGTHKLENFQFPQLLDDMTNRVKLISDTTFNFDVI